MSSECTCLIYHTVMSSGGAQRAMVGYANGLVAVGWKVIFAADMSKVAFSDTGLDRRVVQEDIRCYSLLINSLIVRRLLRKYRPSILFTSMLTPSIICALAKIIYRSPVKLVAKHGTPVGSDESLSWMKHVRKITKYLMVMAAYRYADLILATSPGTASDIVPHFSLNPNKVEVCPNPLPLSQFPLASSECEDGESNVQFDFLCVSRLDENKNVEALIKAFSELSAIHNPLTLCVVGGGPEKGRLEALARRLGVENSVVFVGHALDVSKFYNASRCFVLISKSEEFGMVFVEALRCGLRCIANCKANGPRYIASLVGHINLIEIDSISNVALAMQECLVLSSIKEKHVVSKETEIFSEEAVVRDHLLPCLIRHRLV